MIRFFYRDADGDIQEFTDRVNLMDENVALLTHAEQGSVGTSSLIVDDPLGDWDIGGHRLVFVHEDTASYPRVWAGYTAERDIKRLNPKVLASRQWVVTLVDENSILSRRIMYGAENIRPAETDVERVQWLVTTNEFALIEDTTYLSTAAPVNMDAVDYNGQFGSQILDDCSQASGKNWYAYSIFNSPDFEFGLWYGHSDLTTYSSDIRISNLLGDVDNVTTFAPSMDTNLNRSPSRVYSGVYMPYDGGNVYRQRDATAAAFARRDTNSPSANVKSSGRAIARADRYLSTIKDEEDVIDTTITVPPSQVNDVLAGQRMEAKFTHLPDYEDFSWMRVLKRTARLITPTRYDIDLTLSAKVSVSTPHFLVAFAANGFATQQEDLSTNPWTLAWWSGDFTTASVIGCGAGPPVNQGMGMYYRAIEPSETTTVATFKLGANSSGGMWVYEIAGCDMAGLTVVDDDNEYLADGGTVAVGATATEDSVLFGGVGFGKVNYDDGWLAGGLYSSDIVSDVSGTEIVNKSSNNDSSEVPCPWVWIAHEEGVGSLTISANANAHGAGSGAYSCGWNVGKGGLLIPAPGGFSIVQSGFGGAGIGATYSVVFASPPTP